MLAAMGGWLPLLLIQIPGDLICGFCFRKDGKVVSLVWVVLP